MKALKTYSSPGKLIISLKINDKVTGVEFDGIDTIRKRKTFITKDSEVQEALEASPSFGSFFTLDKTVVLEKEPEVKAESAPEEKPEPEATQEPVEEPVKEGNKLEVKEADSLADAKKWLARDLGEKTYPSMNKKKATSIAEKKGYELIIKK